jgi:hypothetical protein
VSHLDVTYVSHVCCKLFHLDVTYVKSFSKCFASVSDTCCKCFSCFVRMLQVFHLNVSKVDQDVAHVAM